MLIPDNVNWVGPRFGANVMLDRSIDEPFSDQELEQLTPIGEFMYQGFGKNVCEFTGEAGGSLLYRVKGVSRGHVNSWRQRAAMIQRVVARVDGSSGKTLFLKHNGNLSNLQLSERVGLSPSPCLRRVVNRTELPLGHIS